MRSRLNMFGAVWPAILGVSAAHQLAYAGHDDAHIHGYLETVGPGLVVAAVLGWIWTQTRSGVRWRTVMALQAALFSALEVGERLAQPMAVSSLAPVAVGLALLPLVAALAVFADRVLELPTGTDRALLSSDTEAKAPSGVWGCNSAPIAAVWSIRAPPARG